jgi:hypothetical protein
LAGRVADHQRGSAPALGIDIDAMMGTVMTTRQALRMWSLGRRSALFVVSYTPLAAMFLALRWPTGWSVCDLARAGIVVAGTATALVGLFGACFASGRIFTRTLRAVATIGLIAAVGGILAGWTHPQPIGHEIPGSALGAGVAAGFVVAGIELLAVLLHNAARGSDATWVVTDVRDQGASVAAYLATYLLPLLNPDLHGVRTTSAYAIYLATLYVVFVRSDALVVINPMLYLSGYRIFDVALRPPDGAHGRRILLLSRVPIKGTMEVEGRPMGDDCYVAQSAQPL